MALYLISFIIGGLISFVLYGKIPVIITLIISVMVGVIIGYIHYRLQRRELEREYVEWIRSYYDTSINSKEK